jgi:alkylation response protein AidB-like acyl-CoA dehydrogenase
VSVASVTASVTDGFTAPDADRTEALEAVRSVVGETLSRAQKSLAEGEQVQWSVLADAGLLGLVVPEAHGGEGLGLDAAAVLLRGTGERAVQLPVLETLVCGVLTLAAHGSEAQQAALLPGVVSGDVILTPAVREVGRGVDAAPQTSYADGKVSGRKIDVAYADGAARLLVTATEGDRRVVALVDVSDPGVTLLESGSSSQRTTHTVVLDGAAAELLGREDGDSGASASPPPRCSPVPAT